MPPNLRMLWGMLMNLMSCIFKLHSNGMSSCISYIKKDKPHSWSGGQMKGYWLTYSGGHLIDQQLYTVRQDTAIGRENH
jgi:hypothetical protein